MAQITVSTSYGNVTVKDSMLEDDFGGINEGVEIFDELDNFMCEVRGISTDSVENDTEYAEYLINTYSI